MFPKKDRLKNEKDFQKTFSKGKGVYHPLVSLKLRKNQRGYSRFAFVVGVKVTKSAVKRHRLRRQVAAIVRLHKMLFPQGYDMIFFVQKNALEASYKDLEQAIIFLEKKTKFG